LSLVNAGRQSGRRGRVFDLDQRRSATRWRIGAGSGKLSRRGATLLKTYILRFRAGGESAGFRPVLCRTNAQALAEAQAWLEQHVDCETVDVFLGDMELFQVGRPG
jgi:hypothetical protein